MQYIIKQNQGQQQHTSTALLTFYTCVTLVAQNTGSVASSRVYIKLTFPNCPPLLGQDQVCTREAKPRLVGNKAYWFSPSTKIKRKHLQSWANLQPAYPCHRSGSAHSNAPRNVISCWKRHKSLGALNPALAPSYAITQGPLFRGKARGSWQRMYGYRSQIIMSWLTSCERKERKKSWVICWGSNPIDH